jgi:hypothetical protein
MPRPEHHLIYVPGLHDSLLIRRAGFHVLLLIWRLHGFHAHLILPHWEKDNEFAPKLERIAQKVAELDKQGHYVSLVGESAGGSAVLNTFMECRDKIAGVVNITGRLRSDGEPSLEKMSDGSPAFAESVRRCEAALPSLTDEQRQRVITIRPCIDAVVPPETVAVEGATNLVSPARGHSLGGAQIAAIRTAIWMKFLRSVEPRG